MQIYIIETIFFNLTLPSLREEGGQGKGWESILGMIVLSQEQKELSNTIPHSEKITEFIERTLKNIGTMCKNERNGNCLKIRNTFLYYHKCDLSR